MSNRSGPEQIVVNTIIKKAALLGIDLMQFDSEAVKNKFGFYQKSQYVPEGCPDLIGFYCGHFVAVEVKAKGKKILRPKQKEMLERMIQNGCFAMCADSWEDFYEVWKQQPTKEYLLSILEQVKLLKPKEP